MNTAGGHILETIGTWSHADTLVGCALALELLDQI